MQWAPAWAQLYLWIFIFDIAKQCIDSHVDINVVRNVNVSKSDLQFDFCVHLRGPFDRHAEFWSGLVISVMSCGVVEVERVCFGETI
eukprot:6640947-Pyramimonas_sp.AAC.1